jgi:hypothetical protein
MVNNSAFGKAVTYAIDDETQLLQHGKLFWKYQRRNNSRM